MISTVIALALVWSYLSFYTVKPEEKAVELFLQMMAGESQPSTTQA